ncbi:MAG: ribonucleoside-diphosphate reductase, partial [Limosilactobacillus fermentum]
KQEALVAQLTMGAQSLIKLAYQQNEALLEDAGAANDLVDFQWRMLLVALGLGEQPAESGPVAHQIDQLANQAQETVVVETIKDVDATEFMSDDDYDF